MSGGALSGGGVRDASLGAGRGATAAPRPAVGHLLGDPDAPARVVVYGTFECLHCRRAWPALRALADDPAAGVAVEWRHFAPPGAFPNAAGAALAAEAAARQERRGARRTSAPATSGAATSGPTPDGAYWAVHEVLMTAPAPLWPERVDEFAAALGLDVPRLRRDAASDAVRARVEAQRAAALADGVRGTPTAFLDGARLDLDDFEGLREQVQRR
ncbi:MAG TPA: thioredoxin domain-containing protein [Gemmatirosa sp.]